MSTFVTNQLRTSIRVVPFALSVIAPVQTASIAPCSFFTRSASHSHVFRFAPHFAQFSSSFIRSFCLSMPMRFYALILRYFTDTSASFEHLKLIAVLILSGSDGQLASFCCIKSRYFICSVVSSLIVIIHCVVQNSHAHSKRVVRRISKDFP